MSSKPSVLLPVPGRRGHLGGDVFSKVEELRSFPSRPLHPEEINERRSFLTEAGSLLAVTARTLRTDGERDAHRYLVGIVEREMRRVEETANLPYAVADHLARLAETWLGRNPGEALDLRACLTLVLGEPESWSVRVALEAFTVSRTNTGSGAPRTLCRLLVSPNWFASFLPDTYPGRSVELDGDLCAQVLIDTLGEEGVAMALTLWSDDPSSDLFQPSELVGAVIALDR